MVAPTGRPEKLFRDALRKAFPGLSSEAAAELSAVPLRTLTFTTGETVVQQGNWANAFYVITTGEAEVIEYDPKGNELPRDTILGPGDFFGEIGLLMEPKRTASVRATSALEVASMDRAQFDRLVRSSGTAASILSETASARLTPRNTKADQDR